MNPQTDRYVRLRLLALGFEDEEYLHDTCEAEVMRGLLANHRERARAMSDYRCPVDQRIEAFLKNIMLQAGGVARLPNSSADTALRLPGETLALSRAGLARDVSLPFGGDSFENDLLKSYRVRNGVLHNPRSDRRTTQGTFHVADAGLPVPGDKVAVALPVFAELFRRAVAPPRDLMLLPYSAGLKKPAHLFCSLLIRPTVVPLIPGVSPARSMEVRFFAPASLVSKLDLVESIFGNAGDAVLPENDAGLDTERWTGHTGCVVLAPHLVGFTKAELGLPHYDKATPRQRRDGQCWKKADELYNDGQAFKITCRSAAGVIVTLIADNYYGYCKKEVKTQISFAANLLGNAEEEHAGGAVAFPSYSYGDEYHPSSTEHPTGSVTLLATRYPELMDLQPDGHAIDRRFPSLIYIPADVQLDVRTLTVKWRQEGKEHTIPLLLKHVYMTPTGQRFFLNRHAGTGRFRLIMTSAEGTFCHKPCTVSGGGKSEISKSLVDYMIVGPIYVSNLERDLDQVAVILRRDHADRWRPGKAPEHYADRPSRKILDAQRSLGSVIKLLTPSPDYTEEYNKWLASIPSEILALVFLIKRFYKLEWGEEWRSHFTVDIVNGEPGHELKSDDKKVGGTYLRVGLLANGGWRTFKVRQDFYPAAKLQMEDDITASVVVPTATLGTSVGKRTQSSVKLVANCESRLFQRPDDAIQPGLDLQAEADLSRDDNFVSNFEPLTSAAVRDIVERVTEFDRYSEPMQTLLSATAEVKSSYAVCSAYPRMVDGRPSKNPRYLQLRPDLADPFATYVGETGVRLARGLPADAPVPHAVDAVLPGRRNNPPDVKDHVRSLAVYNPIHFQQLPELFMDFISSLTGKSPSTTGAGSEGALTKSPFNALPPAIDLNAALVSYILTGLGGFSTAAGYVGPNIRVGHDISILVPELWCRLSPLERSSRFLIEHGYLDKLEDFEHEGQKVLASRLGYRINYKFIRVFFGRIFDNPARVFDEAMLRPETQGMADYVDGILNITETQQRVAQQYFDDGSVDMACPPLKALLHVMARGNYEGKDVTDPAIRAMFTREYLVESDWYRARLARKQQVDIALWQRHADYLGRRIAEGRDDPQMASLDLPGRLALANKHLAQARDARYLDGLVGTIGADPAVVA